MRALELRRGDEQRLLQELDDARAGALKAIEELQDGHATDAAERLARSLRELDAFEDRLRGTPLDAGDRARLGEQTLAVREALGRAIGDYLEVQVGATPSTTSVRSGDAVTVTVGAVNGGRATLFDARAAVAGPDPAWQVDPAEAQLAGRLQPGAAAEQAFSLAVPASEPPGTVSGTATLSFEFDGAEVTLVTPFELEVVSPVSVESVRGRAGDGPAGPLGRGHHHAAQRRAAPRPPGGSSSPSPTAGRPPPRPSRSRSPPAVSSASPSP